MVAVDGAFAGCVPGPQRGVGHPGDVATNDHLDRQRRRRGRDQHVRVRRRECVVGHDVSGVLEPPPRQLVEHLALVGHARNDPVERRQAVGGHEQPPVDRAGRTTRAPCRSRGSLSGSSMSSNGSGSGSGRRAGGVVDIGLRGPSRVGRRSRTAATRGGRLHRHHECVAGAGVARCGSPGAASAPARHPDGSHTPAMSATEPLGLVLRYRSATCPAAARPSGSGCTYRPSPCAIGQWIGSSMPRGPHRDAGRDRVEHDPAAVEPSLGVVAERSRKESGGGEHLEAVADPDDGPSVGRRRRAARRRRPVPDRVRASDRRRASRHS